MSDAYLDTTVLTNALLSWGDQKKLTIETLRSFSRTFLPVYAIKEFKAGPLTNFVWMHNKLASLNSWFQALAALQKMSRTPRRYTTSTAIQALTVSAESISRRTTDEILQKYGVKSIDEALCAEYRLAIKSAVYKAWKRRRSVTTDVVDVLPCYRETPPIDERGCIVLQPTRCNAISECSLASKLKARSEDLQRLKTTIESLPEKRENQRRKQVLRQLLRKPKDQMSEEQCRDLGDAYFALFCPPGAAILTTNQVDHEPLATALGKTIVVPPPIKS